MITSLIDYDDLRSSLPKIKYTYSMLFDLGEDGEDGNNFNDIEGYIFRYFKLRGFECGVDDIYKIIDICCDLGIAKITTENMIMHYYEWI